MKHALYRSVCLCVAVVAYHNLVRPRLRFWGATREERGKALPGDEVSVHPVLSTHAITITAPRENVWPWLVQIGERRGGFYSYDWIERLLLGGRYLEGHSATRIHPELQDLRVGDEIRLAEPSLSALKITALDPPHHLGLGDDWHFILKDAPGGSRLIVRMRGDGWLKALVHNPLLRLVGGAVDYIVGDPLHFLMERAMLKGIARRAESSSGPGPAATAPERPVV